MRMPDTFGPYYNTVFYIIFFVINVNPHLLHLCTFCYTPLYFQKAGEKPASPEQTPVAETKHGKTDSILNYTASQQ